MTRERIGWGAALAITGLVAFTGWNQPPEIQIEEVAVPSLVEVIVPSPYPSLVEVPVIPEACQVYIDELLAEDIANLDFIIEVYSAYLDYPDENLTEFGRRVEALMTDRPDPVEPVADAGACDR